MDRLIIEKKNKGYHDKILHTGNLQSITWFLYMRQTHSYDSHSPVYHKNDQTTIRWPQEDTRSIESWHIPAKCDA